MASSAGEMLESWKEIADYLKRQVRTVQRWEKLESLPVHRHLHQKRGSVYALKSELDAWQMERRIQSGSELPGISAPGGQEEMPALPDSSVQRSEPFSHRKGTVFVYSVFLSVVLAGASYYLIRRHISAQEPVQRLSRVHRTHPAAVAVGDFNGDGVMDVALAEPASSRISIYFGTKKGVPGPEVKYPFRGKISGMAAADFNRSGRSDLAIAAGGRIVILLSGRQQLFRERQEISLAGVSAILARDFNGNGQVDLVASAGSPASVFVLWGNGDGTFSSPQPITGKAAQLREPALLRTTVAPPIAF